MADVYISGFGGVADRGYQGGAQVLVTPCTQPPVEAVTAAASAWPASPQFAVRSGTKVVLIVLEAAAVVYAGPEITAAEWAKAGAILPVGAHPLGVEPGFVVAVRDL